MNPHPINLAAVLSHMADRLILRIPDILAAIGLVIVFWVIASVVRRALRAAFGRTSADHDVAAMVARILYWSIFGMGIYQALDQLHVSLAPLGIGVGLVSFAVGFALKDVLSNFLSGVMILLTRPFTAGDQIRIKDYEGTIETIQTRGTIIRTADGRKVIIPNQDVFTNAVTVLTAYEHRRLSVLVTVSNQADLEKVQTVILGALKSTPEVTDEPTPVVLVSDLAESGVKLDVRFWCSPAKFDLQTAGSQATKAIKRALETEAIEMPYPTSVVIHRNEPSADM